jgi:hypothetical protein
MKRSKFLDFVWFVIRLPAVFLMTFWTLMKGTKDMWQELKEREDLEKQAEEARKPYAAELDKLKKFNPHDLVIPPLAKFAQTCSPTGKEIVLPFEVCCDFLTAYHAYKKMPSHAHAKQLAGFMESEQDKLAQITPMKDDLKTLDRPEFDRIAHKFYLAFYEVQEMVDKAGQEQSTTYIRVGDKNVKVEHAVGDTMLENIDAAARHRKDDYGPF